MKDYTEEFFRGCVKTLRIVKVLLQSGEPLSKYVIEQRAMVYDSEAVLNRLVKLGIIKVLDYTVKKYEINRENKFVKELEAFLYKIGYL